MKYLVIYEKSETGWGAYAPDLPGLGVAAKTQDEAKELIREAIEFHLEGMRQHGDPIPAPSALTEYITVGSDWSFPTSPTPTASASTPLAAQLPNIPVNKASLA